MRDGFAQTRFGRIHYLEEGSGPPLLLLHTNGNSAYEYEDVIKLLSPKNRVIAWDQPGHGDSDPITRHFRVEDYSDAVIALMDALGLDRVNIFGGSIGGAVAVDLGARYGARIDKLFIVETPVRTAEDWASRWLSTEQNYCIPTQTEAQLAPRLRRLTPQLLERWNLDRNKAGAWVMLDVMWALREFDVTSAMKRVTPKTMLIFGDKSPVSAAAPMFQAAIPGSELVVMKDVGHFPMLDDPEELARIISRFLDA